MVRPRLFQIAGDVREMRMPVAAAHPGAGYSRLAAESVKTLVRMALTSMPRTALKYANAMNALCFAAGDHRKALAPSGEKPDAEFKP
jgi:hypothetical protein